MGWPEERITGLIQPFTRPEGRKKGHKEESMKNLIRAQSLFEYLFIIVIIAILAALLLPALARAREEARKASCKQNLAQMGKAIYCYMLNHNEFFPFSYGSANGPGKASYAAMTSLANLYPEYLSTVKIFRCPSTDDRPNATVNIPKPRKGVKKVSAYAYTQRNWTLHKTSYGYDCRIKPSAPSNHAIMGDMDGTSETNRDTATQNHWAGQNMLYVDGHVKWVTTNKASNNRDDDVFAENKWHADLDSFFVRKDDTKLTHSYARFKDLHPPKAKKKRR
jgi:prepilin-type processing-associated H-X9-DG protein